MENSTARNKHQARQIETWLQNQIAIRGTTNVAKAMGLTKSTVSKWKKDWFPKVAMLLAVLEWGVVDDDMARLAKEVALILLSDKGKETAHLEA
ncbi:TPA: CII family transcriptional regulator [Klebsiella pneumoniae]